MSNNTLTHRQLWQQIMHYGSWDRMPVFFMPGWPETHERWNKEDGLSYEIMHNGERYSQFLGAQETMATINWNIGLYPEFEIEILEETAEYKVYRDREGVVSKEWKGKSSIPHFIDFTLKEAKDWPEYKKRLQPDPRRIPADLDAKIAWNESRGLPIRLDIGSMMGWIRNWMGVENMCYLMYDDRDCYADMVMTIADLMCWGMDQICPRLKSKPDFGFAWEDICGKTGPLVSPDIFRECVAPGYLKMRQKLESYGCTIMGLDSDGYIEPLLKDWMDSGVNFFFPVERGTWDCRAHDLRKKFGKELRMLGNFDKYTMERSRADIDAEFAVHEPLMREGGFIILPDHLITPDTPLKNFQYYLDKVRNWRR